MLTLALVFVLSLILGLTIALTLALLLRTLLHALVFSALIAVCELIVLHIHILLWLIGYRNSMGYRKGFYAANLELNPSNSLQTGK
jgi:hypothetical protein